MIAYTDNAMIFMMIFLRIPQTTMTQGWCCVPYPYPSVMTNAPTVTSPTTITLISKKPQTTTSVTKGKDAISTVQPFYSDWTTWSCTESCGGCGIGRRTRMCLSVPFVCIDAVVEFNHQNCNQHPCPFGKRTCCVNYYLGQIEGHFACLPQANCLGIESYAATNSSRKCIDQFSSRN
uniref:Thrombospondin type 1 domain protein n=1 Tax=Onchocerca volvulus TaxID=6282 RepID=A0A8R1XLI9_ONCVO